MIATSYQRLKTGLKILFVAYFTAFIKLLLPQLARCIFQHSRKAGKSRDYMQTFAHSDWLDKCLSAYQISLLWLFSNKDYKEGAEPSLPSLRMLYKAKARQG